MTELRVTVTGASGLVGSALVATLLDRGAHVTALSRDPARARARLRAGGAGGADALELLAWDPLSEPAPAAALAGRDAVVHLAGENVAQRWSEDAKRAIRDSRVTSTRRLIDGLRGVERAPDGGRPRALICASAVGYYGAHGEEPLDEDAPAGSDFLATLCVESEREADAALALEMRVVRPRIGIVLDARGGALGQMLTPFRLGLGGPVAGGRQYMSWIHRDDLSGLIVAAVEDERFSGPLNATAPEPVSNRDFTRELGRALRRPALLPLPAVALRLRYGEMAQIVTSGVRALPARALVLGYRFRHARLEDALSSLLA